MEPWVGEGGGSRGPPPDAIRHPSSHPLRFSFAQAFGERGADPQVAVQEADMISAVQFNDTGDLIATGDKGGRVVILRQIEHSAADAPAAQTPRRRRGHRRKKRQPAADPHAERVGANSNSENGGDVAPAGEHDSDSPAQMSANGGSSAHDDAAHRDPAQDAQYSRQRRVPPEFRFWTQFQSHEPEFDYLKSMEIEEKINQIRWCRRVNGAHRLLSTNDKTVKLWRVAERETTSVCDFACDALRPSNPSTTHTSNTSLQMLDRLDITNGVLKRAADTGALTVPKFRKRGTAITATSRRTFGNAHAYHINSLSINSDDETFLSADDLRINLWNFEVGGVGFNVLDIKPDNMEDLSEVITAAEFHPSHCHLFMYSTSRGSVKLCDLRSSALCETWVREFDQSEDDGAGQSFFSEIIASVSDVKFSPCGRYIVTRDFTTLRLWDVHMEREPILTIPVHESLRSRLCDFYENDCIFDKFQCAFSADAGSIVTGSYNALLQSFSAFDGRQSAVETSVDYVSGATGRNHMSSDELATQLLLQSSIPELVDPTRRVMHLTLSSQNQIVAAATGPALYIYYA